MQIFSYPGCQTCLVKMCCQNVCKEYRQHVFETKDINILIDKLSLKKAENIVAMGHTETVLSFKTGDVTNVVTHIVKLKTDIKGVVSGSQIK